MNGKILFQMTALAAGLLFGAAGVRGQGGGTAPAGSAPAAAGAKIAVVNIQQAVGSTAEGKQASAELQSKYASRQNDLQNMNKQIEDLRNRLLSGERTLSDEEKSRLQREGQLRARQLERKQTEYQEDVNAEQGEIVERIGRRMLDVLDRYARENGYLAVLDVSQQNLVLYSAPQIDITQDIVRLYDQAYPVRAGAAPAQPKPAQPRPATQQPPAQQKPPQQKPQQ